MSEQGLMVRDDSRLAVSFTTEAVQLQQRSLELAALIGRVSSADEQQNAVDAQKALVGVLHSVEKARKLAKEPVLNYGRAIDGAAARFIEEVRQEDIRIAKLIADFQALELAKVRAREAAENERLLAIERERAQAQAQVKTHEELDAINADFDARVKDEVIAPIAPVRAEGQSVSEGWAFEIFDVWALAQSHPECVKPPDPRRTEIKALLDAGVKLAGVRAWKEVKAGVRLARERKAITV